MNKLIIGALHFNPLIGYEGYLNYENILKKALLDLKSFEDGGIDMIIVENNYNLPHRINETEESNIMMELLLKDLTKHSRLPFGISILWNDYKSAFEIAVRNNLKFIRVPVFVDSVKTSFGDIIANPEDVINTRRILNAENILIYADIHVKHAVMLDQNKTLGYSAKEARSKGADGIIITGQWTGDSPNLDDLKIARNAVGYDFPIIIGSGASKENVKQLLECANAVIVSTSLKEGELKDKNEERNLKPYDAKIDVHKVKEFMAEVNK